jgi:hypothetical protein
MLSALVKAEKVQEMVGLARSRPHPHCSGACPFDALFDSEALLYFFLAGLAIFKKYFF